MSGILVIVTSTRSSSLLNELGEAIAKEDYPAGTVLLIPELAARHGVSRTVVREALQVLASMRMVTAKRGVGVTVQPVDSWNLYDPLVIRWRLDVGKRAEQLALLTELRTGIEPIAARLAAGRCSPEQAGELITLARYMATTAEARDLDTFLVHDIAFHRLVLTASGNAMFAQLGDPIAEVLRGRTHHDLMPAQPHPDAVRLHMAVAHAIASQDGQGAEAAARAIIDLVAEEMRDLR